MKIAPIEWHDLKTEKPPFDVALIGCGYNKERVDGDYLLSAMFMVCTDWPSSDPTDESIDGYHVAIAGPLNLSEIELWGYLKEEDLPV